METNKIQQNTEKTDVSKAPEGAKDRPVKEYRAGGIIVTVWKNQTKDNKVYHTTTIKRTFTLDGKTFKECNHFGLNDLPRLILLSGEAYRYILLNKE